MPADTISTEALRRPKRGHGEGTIYLRESDGRYVGTIMLGRKADGKPDRPKVTGSTEGEVRKQLRELRREYERGMRADTTHARDTLAAYLAEWLAVAQTTTRASTHERYEKAIRLHIVPTLGKVRLTDLRAEQVQRLYADKLKEGQSPRSVEKIHVVLHRALKIAVQWGRVPRNVIEGVYKPKASKFEITPPDPAQLADLIQTANAAGDRLAALWTLAIYSGCREGELLGLGWSDVNLDAGTLTVRRGLTSVKNQTPTFGEPKSANSRRTIAISTEAIAALRALKVRQNAERLAAEDWADYGLVFTTQVGTPLMVRNVIRDFKRATKRAGLPSTVRFHDLRHANATLMLRSGVPLKVASGRLGHAGVGITADLYQHVSHDMDTDAAERVARAMVK